MAVRPQRIHDGGIVERRLRPIYDWLDNGNNKKALQEAEKVLKKSPTLQAARALKALALLRLGKASECHAVLDALVEEKPSDDTTLQAMTISYRESHQLPKVCEIYEAAVKVDPTNEELYSHLFMSYVRIGDHRSQQRTAMALYKFAPKNPYYFWAVMSIVLQAKTADDSTKRNILLALAQRMVENFITENKMEAEQEARLYIMILELQEKWGDILKFIESPLYSQLVPGSTSQACLPYFKKIGEWRRLNLLCKDLLWDNQDRWDFYMPYFDSVFQLMKKQSAESENSVDDTPEKCHEFICSIVESMSSGRMLRGPYLARLELWKRLAQGGDPTSLLGSGAALCLQYLRVFANKTCAVPDLKPYLSMLAQKEREDHSRDFLTCLGFDENSEPDNTNDIQRHVSCLSAWRLTAPSGTAEENINIANLLRRHYLRCLEKGLVTATLTEFCAADSYGTLAAHHYFYAAIEQENPAPIIEALNLLELVLHHSPANFHAKLLLISLYHILGNALAADSIYNKLEVKHIQLVSLGWLHAARLAPALAPARALRLLADTCAFHKHHAKDSVEQVTYAYKFGTFEKVAEVWAWGARVEACAWCAACGRDRALLALLAGPQPLQPLHRLPHAPTDNRDLNAIVSWCGAEAEREQRKARSFERDVAYLRLKDGLLSAIALCIECADNRSVDEKSSQFEELRVCIAAFGDALDTCRGVYGARDPLSVCAPLPSRIIALVTSPVPYRELYTSALGVVCEVCGGRHARAHAAAERAGRALAASRGHLAAHARPDLWRNRDALEFYSNYLEFIGVITFLLGVCNEFVAPANAKKSKKKTSQSPEQIKTIEMLNQLNDQVQQTIAQLEDIFENWPKFEYDTSLEDEFAKLNITNKYQSPVEQKLKSGMDDVLADVKNILKKKAKYLKSLQ